MYVSVRSLSIAADEVISASNILIPADNGVIASLGTCAYIYLNLDTVEYSVCPTAFVSFLTSKTSRIV
jgi:hypothetical protein